MPVFHFHLHVVPRYIDKSKDSLVLPWQPGVAGDTRTLSTLGARIAQAVTLTGGSDRSNLLKHRVFSAMYALIRQGSHAVTGTPASNSPTRPACRDDVRG